MNNLEGRVERLEYLINFRRGTSAIIAGGAVQLIRFPIALVTVAAASAIPAGSVVIGFALDVRTPYSPGTTLQLGRAGSVALLMAGPDSTPGIAGLYNAPSLDDVDWGGAPLPPLCTIAGAPAAGAGFALVAYAQQPLT